MIAVSMARSTRSGSGVGPGICRKWRPTEREEFFIVKILALNLVRCRRKRRNVVMKDECTTQSRPAATIFAGAKHSVLKARAATGTAGGEASDGEGSCA